MNLLKANAPEGTQVIVQHGATRETFDGVVCDDGIIREDIPSKEGHRPAFSSGQYKIVWVGET